MRVIKVFILIGFIAISLTSCMDDPAESPTYYGTIGVISKTSDSLIIEADNDLRFLIFNFEKFNKVKNGDRVIASFTIQEETNLPVGIDYFVDVSEITIIPVAPVFVYDSTNSDSIGNDVIRIDQIGVSKNFLNLSFYVLGSGEKSHRINLVRYEGDLRTDTIDLEIRHNGLDDTEYEWLYGFFSFDLTPLKNEVTDSVVLRVRANDYNIDNYEKFFTYKF
jgi:hypothetical protein